MISFIVPAHNEAAWIGHCLTAIQSALTTVGEPYEIIVVDDASADNTGPLAQAQGARVLRVEHRHISATRNAGGQAARGDVLFFVDADTQVQAALLTSALAAVRSGAVGGACVPHFDGALPLWFRLVYPLFVAVVRLFRQPGGSCIFCSRSAFAAAGGFSEAHFAAEDALFISTLKRQGRVFVPPLPVTTSGRNLRAHSPWRFFGLLCRLALRGPDAFRRRDGLDMWYRPARDRQK